MDIRKIRTCEKCKASVPLDKVRLFPKDMEKSILVCEDCCNKLKNPEPTTKKPIRNTAPNVALKHCKRCKYSFRIDLNKAGRLYRVLCPLCGKSEHLE